MDDHIILSGDEGEEEVGSVPNKAEIPSASNASKDKGEKKHKPNLSGNPSKRQRKLTSGVWDDFEMLKELDVNGNMQCKCKRCGSKYIAESSHGTGNLLRHRKSCKGKNYKDIGQLLLQSNLNGLLGTRNSTYKPDEFRELVAIAIARHNLPLQFVEYEGIRKCFTYLCPEVKFFCRNTIKKDIHKMYLTEKSKLLDLLQLVPGRIALTSDCWTSVTTDGYISLTAHYVDQNWCLQKKVLAFSLMPPPHTGVALAEKVYDLLKVWGIHKKIISITLDNASSNVMEYWKSLQGRYPVVSQMARDILAIPISTVASESVFSIGGRVLDAYRSSLKPETAEELVCLRDWVFKDASLQPEIEALCKQTLALKVDDDDNENESTPSSQTQQSVG